MSHHRTSPLRSVCSSLILRNYDNSRLQKLRKFIFNKQLINLMDLNLIKEEGAVQPTATHSETQKRLQSGCMGKSSAPKPHYEANVRAKQKRVTERAHRSLLHSPKGSLRGRDRESAETLKENVLLLRPSTQLLSNQKKSLLNTLLAFKGPKNKHAKSVVTHAKQIRQPVKQQRNSQDELGLQRDEEPSVDRESFTVSIDSGEDDRPPDISDKLHQMVTAGINRYNLRSFAPQSQSVVGAITPIRTRGQRELAPTPRTLNSTMQLYSSLDVDRARIISSSKLDLQDLKSKVRA